MKPNDIVGQSFETYLEFTAPTPSAPAQQAQPMPSPQRSLAPDASGSEGDSNMGFHLHNPSLDKVYDRYMPYILQFIKTPVDFKQLMAKINYDLQNHKMASSSTDSQLNNMRGRDFNRYGNQHMT